MRKPKANARRGGSKTANMEEAAYAFRRALSSDLSVAGQILSKHPELIDYPVFGKSESALHFFAVENRQDVVSWLIAYGANPKGVAKEDFTLHDVALLGHREVCGMLLTAGSDPNLKDSVGETALHKASRNGHLEVLELLLASGADPTIAEMCGELPVDQALPRKRELVRALFDRHATSRQTKA